MLDQDREGIVKTFGNKLRVRVNGIYVEDGRILMIRHKSLGESGIFWSPPGGGMEFGSSVSENLEREFQEETGLRVKMGRFLFVHEYLRAPLHAVELFFAVDKIGGRLELGKDPEMADAQIISEVRLMSMNEIKSIDKASRHQVFELCDSVDELLQLSGYYRL